ncbi:MAG: HD domain-containing phosphohydrolase, partial [Alphaproteobacteria bacterium]
FKKYPISALCRYNLDKFSPHLIKNIIQVHPIILWNSKVHENPYYIPTHDFAHGKLAEAQVRTWLDNIGRFTDQRSRFHTIFQKKQEEIAELNKVMTSGIISAFLKLLETHDPYTKDHCSNVAALALQLAKRLKKPGEFSAKLYYAALIHDFGKTIIPKGILNKPEELTDQEYAQIKMHPVYGAEALCQIDQMEEIAAAVRYHHERPDGRGYPAGLKDEEIPLMAKIIVICDSYDAMTNDRPYRKARSHQEALAEIKACAGTQFDPVLVEHFLPLFP